MGRNSTSEGTRSIAIGDGVISRADSVAIGSTLPSFTFDTVLVGIDAQAGERSVSLGSGTIAATTEATAVGSTAFSGREGVAIGS